MILLTAFFISLIIWIFVSIYHFAKTGTIKLFHFPFSEKNYYIMMSGIPLAILILSIYRQNAQTIAQFLFFAVAGVFGETLFSLWWHSFFGQRFWIYTTETVYHSYTSVLNFIPWGITGLLSMDIAQIIVGKSMLSTIFASNSTYIMLSVLYFGSLTLQIVIFLLIREFHHNEFKFHEVTTFTYFFFIFPILVVLVYFGITFSYNFFLLAVTFGSFFSFAEYCFGKGVHLFISKKLWSYTYIAFDNGHFSPLSIVPFIVAGFWFLIVYGFFNKFLFS